MSFGVFMCFTNDIGCEEENVDEKKLYLRGIKLEKNKS